MAMKDADAEVPLVQNPPGWGDINDVLAAPAQNVVGADSWLSVIGCFIFLLPSLIVAAFGGLIKSVFVCYCVGSCISGTQACCSVLGLVKAESPLYMAWVWWRANFAGLIALLANKKSRLGLFLWEQSGFGDGLYWWHGEGVWTGSHGLCDEILKSPQFRKPAFGCIRACTPDLFADNLLIFLSNDGPDSEWACIRKLLHQFFLDQGLATYKKRVAALPDEIAADWKEPSLANASKQRLSEAVAKMVFFVMFGVWIEDSEAKILAQWRGYAGYFVLPRLVQRMAFNTLINKVKKLRKYTVGLVEKYGKQDIFIDMNNKLPEGYRREQAVKLCDEMMFVIGFAGIGGTAALVESTTSFLQCKIPEESPGEKYIKFGNYNTLEKMVEKYRLDPEKYFREVGRIDPPVTSATCTLKRDGDTVEDYPITLAGKVFTLPSSMLQQYCIGVANRDEQLFPTSSNFDPDRKNLNKALTWNGAFGISQDEAGDEALYPRICPGRYLSLSVAQTVVNHALRGEPPN